MQTIGENLSRICMDPYNNGLYTVIGGKNSVWKFPIVFSWKKAFFFSTMATHTHKSPALIGVQQPSNNRRYREWIRTRQTGPQCDVWKHALLFLIFRVLKTLLLLLLFSVLFCFRCVFRRILRVPHSAFPPRTMRHDHFSRTPRAARTRTTDFYLLIYLFGWFRVKTARFWTTQFSGRRGFGMFQQIFPRTTLHGKIYFTSIWNFCNASFWKNQKMRVLCN